ncbi:alpha/beta fold hydrolase [Streptomyces sp. NPDC005046]
MRGDRGLHRGRRLAARLPLCVVLLAGESGHGDCDRAADYSREGYLADLKALMDHLGLDRAVLVGHSLGAINAYQFAARHPQRVSALVNGEGCAELGLDGGNPLAFVLNLPREPAPAGRRSWRNWTPSLPSSNPPFVKRLDGTWGLRFHPKDIHTSESQVHGDHWADGTGSACPALLIRGARGGVLSARQAAQMAGRRPGTRLVELATDHFLYVDDPAGFADAVRDFLASPQPWPAAFPAFPRRGITMRPAVFRPESRDADRGPGTRGCLYAAAPRVTRSPGENAVAHHAREHHELRHPVLHHRRSLRRRVTSVRSPLRNQPCACGGARLTANGPEPLYRDACTPPGGT